MKIAYLANIRFPSERAHSAQIAHMCQAFAELNNNVDLFVNKISIKDAGITGKYFGLNIKFKIFNIPPKFFYPKYKIFFYISELIFSVYLLFKFKFKFKQYDIIFSRGEWIVFFLSFFVCKNKLIWESHEAKLNFPARYILGKGVKTVVISDGIYNDYIKWGVPRNGILVAHDGVDDSFFETTEDKVEVRKKLSIPDDQKVVMYIGGFDEWKGVETFFAAAELCPEFSFYAIGGRVDQINLHKEKYPKVNFLGAKPYNELSFNQQAADVLVIPNSGVGDLSSRYTSPLKLFAHMASGIPILVSDIQSMSSVLSYDDATFFEPDNSISLSKGVISIFTNYNDKVKIAERLVEKSKRFTWNNRAREILNFIK